MSSLRLHAVLVQAPNPELERLLTHLRVWSRLDCRERPRAWLGVEDGRVVLVCENPRAFFRRLDTRAPRVVALTAAPSRDCALLDGAVLLFEGLRRRVRWAKGAPGHLPWERRTLFLEDPHIQPLTEPREPGVVLARTGDAGLPPLYLEPLPMDVDEPTFADLWRHGAFERSNALFLPPVRPACARTYFDGDLLDLRAGLRRAWLGESEPTCAEHLWSACDDPLLRDLLLDGAGLRATGRDGEPTSFALELPPHASGACAAYRRGFLFGDDVSVQPEFAALRSAVRCDLQEVLPRLSFEPGERPVRWELGHHTRSPEARTGRGAWTRIARLAARLSSESAALDEHVLAPTAVLGDLAADHDGAERRFLDAVFRCPWDVHDRTWRSVFLGLLHGDWDGERIPPARRVEEWGARLDWLRWNEQTLEHPCEDLAAELLELRLLLPSGTRFCRRGVLRFDEPSTPLDRAVLG